MAIFFGGEKRHFCFADGLEVVQMVRGGADGLEVVQMVRGGADDL